jgi:hypothetical protein
MSDDESEHLQDLDELPDNQAELLAEFERRRRVINSNFD